MVYSFFVLCFQTGKWTDCEKQTFAVPCTDGRQEGRCLVTDGHQGSSARTDGRHERSQVSTSLDMQNSGDIDVGCLNI